MNNRLVKFLELAEHPYFSKVYKKLTKDDINCCIEFLMSTYNESKDEFAISVRNLGLKIHSSNKKWALIDELLICSNI